MRKLSILLIFALILVTNCTKNPSGPSAPESSLVYINAYNKVLIIDSSQDKIVDSMKFDFPVWGLHLSSDGEVLYLKKAYTYSNYLKCYPNCPDSFVEVDLNSRSIRYQGENSSLFATPDGRYLVSTSKGLKLFSSWTHQMVYENNLDVTTRPTFDTHYPLIYVGVKDNKILVFDYARLATVRFLTAIQEKNFREVYDLLFSEVDNRLYFSALDSACFLFLGNVDTKFDRIAGLKQLSHSYGSLGFLYDSPTTKRIYLYSVVYPSPCAIPEIYWEHLVGFSPRTLNVISELRFLDLDISPFSLHILATGKKAYAEDNLSRRIIIFDLIQNSIIGTIPMP